ncbi:MAG: hypothetical protein HY245_14195 [Rhizobiales bacterium]|nr:hypothetical protein [Hyphomicrobiales bacterium]MBI3674543.1 hypothetical protein [Hyphomicrobiales bacterium]
MRHGIAVLLLAALLADGASAAQPLRIGKVTWHAAKFVGKRLTLTGFLLARRDGYVYVSDEATGKIGPHDLAVTGPGLDGTEPARRYVMVGDFLESGLAPDNGSKYHLELAEPPQPQ